MPERVRVECRRMPTLHRPIVECGVAGTPQMISCAPLLLNDFGTLRSLPKISVRLRQTVGSAGRIGEFGSRVTNQSYLCRVHLLVIFRAVSD